MKNSQAKIQVYTGNGKGKTTAAIGLAIRAVGHDLKVFIGQFMKGSFYGELRTLEDIPNIDIVQFGSPDCIRKEDVTEFHKKKAEEGLAYCHRAISSGEYDLVILDEINVTIWFELLALEDVLVIIKDKPNNVELVLTGRYAPQEIINIADLVTEMKEIKHYYSHGIEARDGIER